jgi:hypothetical protein
MVYLPDVAAVTVARAEPSGVVGRVQHVHPELVVLQHKHGPPARRLDLRCTAGTGGKFGLKRKTSLTHPPSLHHAY